VFIDAAEKAIESWPNELIQDGSKPIAIKISVEIAKLGKTWRYLEIPDGAL
jgi:hypothetical protein